MKIEFDNTFFNVSREVYKKIFHNPYEYVNLFTLLIFIIFSPLFLLIDLILLPIELLWGIKFK